MPPEGGLRSTAELPRFLSGRKALVTSASRNLGAVIAAALAARGASVAVNYHSSRKAAEQLLVTLPTIEGQRHVIIAGDSTSGEGVRRLTDAALNEFEGRIDVLVNNSGPFSMTPFADLPEMEWDRILNANLKAVYVATQEVVPGMRTAGWGRIVNLSAGSSFLRNHSIYGMAKRAIETLTESLALELGPEITVNAVAPGQILESAPDVTAIDPTFVGRAVDRTPAGRLVTRAEVGEVITQLCHPSFDMLTGATLPLDGGWRFNRF